MLLIGYLRALAFFMQTVKKMIRLISALLGAEPRSLNLSDSDLYFYNRYTGNPTAVHKLFNVFLQQVYRQSHCSTQTVQCIFYNRYTGNPTAVHKLFNVFLQQVYRQSHCSTQTVQCIFTTGIQAIPLQYTNCSMYFYNRYTGNPTAVHKLFNVFLQQVYRQSHCSTQTVQCIFTTGIQAIPLQYTNCSMYFYNRYTGNPTAVHKLFNVSLQQVYRQSHCSTQTVQCIFTTGIQAIPLQYTNCSMYLYNRYTGNPTAALKLFNVSLQQVYRQSHCSTQTVQCIFTTGIQAIPLRH